MPKVAEYENYHIVIYPKSMTDFGYVVTSRNFDPRYRGEKGEENYHRDMKERLREIESQIKRHVDNVETVRIKFETNYFCSYCNMRWEEEENGMPVCCTKAQEDWKKENENAS